ncbi:MAG: hypothetical protein Q9227_001437 [Pyrenula ochraceoflavens]
MLLPSRSQLLLYLLIINLLCISQALDQEYFPAGSNKAELLKRWQFDWSFSGISTFAHLKHVKCLTEPEIPFDIGIIGVPFDTAVSYRPGARFGPRAIRAASARQSTLRGFNHRRGLNPYMSNFSILDCGDIPITAYDNALALKQMSSAFLELGSRKPLLQHSSFTKTKLLALGGDHSIVLPALRALNKIYGQPIAVLHFDAHLDTWDPDFPTVWSSEQTHFNHGSAFWLASKEGLILNGSSVHAGLRTRLTGVDWADYEDDDRQGFLRLPSDSIDEVGTRELIDRIMQRIGENTPVYLSIDIDVIDPSLAPGTGTPEAGGWTSREMIRILRGLESLNVVGADIVEVAPAYDGTGEQTSLIASQFAFEIITNWVGKGLQVIGDTQARPEPNMVKWGRDEL